jgi:DNA-binding transcriptional LysR family regulator
MEAALGLKLVDRRSRQLTAAGDIFARHVLRAEAILAQAVRVVSAYREPSVGSLSVIASGTPGTYLLPDLVAAFQAAHPGIQMTFTLGTSTEVVNAVRAHRAEIGITGGFLSPPEIEAEPLLEDELVIVGSPAFKGKRVSRDELESQTWLTRETGSATGLLTQNALSGLGIEPARWLALPAWESIKIAVQRGHGLAAFSKLAVTEELKAGTLVVIPFRPWKVKRMFSIVRIRDASLTPAAESFVAALRARWPAGRSAHA